MRLNVQTILRSLPAFGHARPKQRYHSGSGTAPGRALAAVTGLGLREARHRFAFGLNSTPFRDLPGVERGTVNDPICEAEGSALIGGYLNSIGIPWEAIYKMNMPGPDDDLMWLNAEEAKRLRIPVEEWPE